MTVRFQRAIRRPGVQQILLRAGMTAACSCLALVAPAVRGQIIVIWNNGNASWNSGSNWTGNGGVGPGASDTAQVGGGAASVDSDTSISNLALSGGGIGGSAKLTLTGVGSTWTGGTMNGSGAAVIASGGSLTISSSANHDFSGRMITNNGT